MAELSVLFEAHNLGFHVKHSGEVAECGVLDCLDLFAQGAKLRNCGGKLIVYHLLITCPLCLAGLCCFLFGLFGLKRLECLELLGADCYLFTHF